MTKPWSERPLWEKCHLGPHSKAYLRAGRLIGHLGTTPFAFYDAAKRLPGYDQYQFENAVRDLTRYAAREASPPRYELHPQAKKVLRAILGPDPSEPAYAAWWRNRLVSVRLMREAGQPVEWADEPPVPLPEDNRAAEGPEEKTTRPAKKARPRKKPAKG